MRVLLADDHDLVRDALAALMRRDSPDVDLVTACDLSEALTQVATSPVFDVITLDLCMPGMDGLSGVERMMLAAKNTPIIIMSGTARSADIHAALRLGVMGFVPKTLAGRSLMNAVRLVASGEVYVPMEYIIPAKAITPGQGALTPRESDVLYELRRGNSNKEIARSLEIAETTVKLHLRTLSEKLQARNRTDIVVRAIDMGLA